MSDNESVPSTRLNHGQRRRGGRGELAGREFRSYNYRPMEAATRAFCTGTQDEETQFGALKTHVSLMPEFFRGAQGAARANDGTVPPPAPRICQGRSAIEVAVPHLPTRGACKVRVVLYVHSLQAAHDVMIQEARREDAETSRRKDRAQGTHDSDNYPRR